MTKKYLCGKGSEDMYSFAICEDETESMNYLSEQIIQTFEKCGKKIHLEKFDNGRSLIDAIRTGKKFDALFLDIVMPDVDGFQVCKILKTWEMDILVIFVSANDELVFQSFGIRPFSFLRKNYVWEDLEPLAIDIIGRLRRSDKKQIVIQEERSDTIHVFPVKHMLYAEAQLRTCKICLQKEEVYVRYIFRNLESQLIPSGFIKVHRSFLVNYRFIYQIDKREVVLVNGNRIPVSRDRIGDVKKEFMFWNRR